MTGTPTTTVTTRQECCRDAHLRHCHGTWMVHHDDSQECTDPSCHTPAEGHAVTVLCADLEPVCRCR